MTTTLDGGARQKHVRLGGAPTTYILIGGEGDDTLSGDAGMDTLQGGLGADAYVFGAKDGADTLTDVDGANTLNFKAEISYGQLWLVRSGADLKVSVIGGDTVVTVANFFAATGGSHIRAVQTTSHVLFLDHPDTLNLVTAMTAAARRPRRPCRRASPPCWASIGTRTAARRRPFRAARVVTTNEDTPWPSRATTASSTMTAPRWSTASRTAPSRPRRHQRDQPGDRRPDLHPDRQL